jgi:hypothetical protein
VIAVVVCLLAASPALVVQDARGQAPPQPRYTITPSGQVVPRDKAQDQAPPPGQAKPQPKGAAAERRVHSDFDEPPSAPGGSAARAPVRRDEPAVDPGEQRRLPALDLGSPLLDMFQRIGHPSDLASLGRVVTKLRLSVYDSHGSELGVRELVHEADCGVVARDRLTVQAGLKVYGRDGEGAWVVFHGMDWPALESEARDELELFGLLLRTPWCFADPQRFVVYPKENVLVDGKRITKLRIETRTAGDELVGPRETKPPADSFELFSAPDSLEPCELRLVRANGTRRTIRLLDWRDVAGVRMPQRRLFVGPDGGRALEIVTTLIDTRQALPDARFRPPAR